MTTIFDNRSVDLEKFCTFPKCTGTWSHKGFGCLFTALWSSMGFKYDDRSGCFIDPLRYVDDSDKGILAPEEMCEEFDKYVTNLMGIELKFGFTSPSGICRSYTFTDQVIELYDSAKEVEAVNLLWTVIEKMPKIGYATKDQLVDSIPACSV